MTAPFLLSRSTPQTTGEAMPGRYCDATDMWVVETDQGQIPYIEAFPSEARMLTKTSTVQEQDDENAMIGLGQVQTKTEAQIESDDTRPTASPPELLTKTDVIQEQDDQKALLV